MSTGNYKQQFEDAFPDHHFLPISIEILFIEGLEKQYIKLSNKKVEYVYQQKQYELHPEEIIRAATFVQLITHYNYSEEFIDFEVPVPRRTPSDFADIVVYNEKEEKSPFIVIEVKKDGINPSEFVQSIEQAFGNANSFRAKYCMAKSGNVKACYNVSGFGGLERQKNLVADIPIQYGKVVQYLYSKEHEFNELKVVNLEELLKKFNQCHNILWENGKRNPAEAFDEMSKLMFAKIYDERFLTHKNKPYGFQIGTYETAKIVADRIHNIYDQANIKDDNIFKDTIKLDNEIIYNIVQLIQGITLHKTELDAKGVAFEKFLGSVFRGQMGQYFTPRQIVKFMVSAMNPMEDDMIIDPACGSGGFLIHIIDEVRRDLENKLGEEDATARGIDFAKYNVYGIEINSQLSKISMMNMILHKDGHTNIESSDALDEISRFNPKRDIQKNKFSLLLTNPPFGGTIKYSEHKYLKKYKFGKTKNGKVRASQRTEILFIERCIDLVKPEIGRIAMVLPDGILSNSKSKFVRDYIKEKCQILAIISLPHLTFTPYGTGVKTSLVFLRKLGESEKLDDYEIFMGNIRNVGYDAQGKEIPKNDLPEVLQAYKEFNSIL